MDIERYKKVTNSSLLEFSDILINTYIPTPVDIDYIRGYVRRYFVRKVNDSNGIIFEVGGNEFTRLQSKPLYIRVSVKWRISGPKEIIMNGDKIVDNGVINSNRLAIKYASEKIENLSLYLPNLLQFHK
jgi:hypothetical protein